MQTCEVIPQELELEHTGSFDIVRVTGDETGRCGILGSPRTLAYRVCITSAPQFLDDNGFIIDWQHIRDYFRETYRNLAVFPSCERIACRACSDIVTLLDERAMRVEVTVGSGARAAGMKAVWRRP